MWCSTSSGACVTLTVIVILEISTSESKPSTFHGRRRHQTLTVLQAEEGYCSLPPPLENGRFSPSRNNCPPYTSNPACQMITGTPVPPNWAIYYACNPGYKLQDGKMASVCFQGQWRPSPPTCVVDSCKLPLHPTHGRYIATNLCRSYVEGVNACREIPGSVVPPSWKLKYTCNPGYQLNSSNEYSVCENGVWNNPVDCVEVSRHIPRSGGTTAKSNQFTCPEPNLLTFGDHSRHPLPGNCHLYVMCIRDGTYKVGSCEVGKAYDKMISMCRPTHQVKC